MFYVVFIYLKLKALLLLLYFIFINIYSIFIIQFMVSFILTYIELYSICIIILTIEVFKYGGSKRKKTKCFI